MLPMMAGSTEENTVVIARPSNSGAIKEPTGVLARGAKAPSFSLLDAHGERLALHDLEGKWVVAYFYPKDNTPGCSREAAAFQAAAAEFARRNAVVVGISRDSVESHAKFKAKLELGFALLSDPTAEAHQAYGAFGEKTMYGKTTVGALRTTVVIRPNGKVARVFARVKVDGHAEAVLRALDEEIAAER